MDGHLGNQLWLLKANIVSGWMRGTLSYDWPALKVMFCKTNENNIWQGLDNEGSSEAKEIRRFFLLGHGDDLWMVHGSPRMLSLKGGDNYQTLIFCIHQRR
ncbi:hypothetical protein QQP08_023779 [Theobroma cacao]|nr:hypothetical protein QQP08_023779 [Theobroma cacao]